MKILIKAEGSPKDWYIVEFQGTVESPDGSLEGRDLGTMFMRDVRFRLALDFSNIFSRPFH